MGDCTFASLQVKLLPTARFQHISEWDVGRSWHSYPREGKRVNAQLPLVSWIDLSSSIVMNVIGVMLSVQYVKRCIMCSRSRSERRNRRS